MITSTVSAAVSVLSVVEDSTSTAIEKGYEAFAATKKALTSDEAKVQYSRALSVTRFIGEQLIVASEWGIKAAIIAAVAVAVNAYCLMLWVIERSKEEAVYSPLVAETEPLALPAPVVVSWDEIQDVSLDARAAFVTAWEGVTRVLRTLARELSDVFSV